MEKKEQFVNYLLSIGFIFLVVLFLSSMIFISRFVLSTAEAPINQHIQITKNILDDIKEVKPSKNESYGGHLSKESYLRVNYKNFNLEKPYFININKNKSIFTFRINGEIKNENNIYYKKVDLKDKFNSGDLIAYKLENFQIQTGLILEINIKEKMIKILNSRNKIERIEFKNLLGKVFFIGESINNKK